MGYTPSSGLIATHSLFLTVAATASPMLSQTCSESLQGIPVLGIQHVDLKSLCIDQIVRVFCMCLAINPISLKLDAWVRHNYKVKSAGWTSYQ